MKRSLKKLKRIYKLGMKWSMFRPEDELVVQAEYIAIVIAELCVLWNKGNEYVGLYAYLLIAKYVIMCFLGYKADKAKSKRKRYMYKRTYFIVTFYIAGLGIMLTNSNTIIGLLLFPALMSMFLYYFLLDTIFDIIGILNVKTILSSKENINFFAFGIMLIFLTAPLFSLALIPINIFLKILIILVFFALVPLIVVAADNGMNFIDFYDFFRFL